MIEIKKFNVDNLEEINQALLDVPHRLGFGTTEVTKKEYLNFTEKILRSNTHSTWGFYKDEILISFMSSFDFPNLPYYGVLNFKVVKGTNYFSQVKSGFFALLNHITKVKEGEKRYTFYMTRAIQRNADVRKKLYNEWEKNFPEFFKKYTRTIEEVIPAGQLSQFDYYNKALLRDKVYDNDMMIMQFVCKNEFRTGILTGSQEAVSLSIDKDLRKFDTGFSFN
jgi:hypothetical protein